MLLHLRDIRLPFDDPPKLHRHWYGEQYVLAMHLLGTPNPKGIIPRYWAWEQPEMKAEWDDYCIGGSSFWFET